MPRRRRFRLPNYPIHVVQRGNNRSKIFFGEKDYWFYLFQLAELAPRTSCAIHAYVLMPNHVHLLLTPQQEGGMSILMKHLAQRHAQYVNREHARTGALWEGRFHSSVIDTERYLMHCYRYVELNPIRAGLVENPSMYQWSSHLINNGGRPSSLITPHDEYVRLGATERERRKAYGEFFRTAQDASTVQMIRESLRSGILGSDEFKEKLGSDPA